MPSFSIAKMLKSIINRKGMPGVLFLILLSSCSGDSPVSRRYPCHFTFHTEWHPASMIFAALNTNNYYVSISMSVYHGAYVVTTSDPNGKKESITLTNDIENLAYNSGIYLGAGGTNGSIILGHTNFNGYVAWDGQCPNCATGYTTKYPLQWTDNTTVVRCNNCHRTYSLETGAILSGNNGERLMQYVVSLSPGGVLGVGN